MGPSPAMSASRLLRPTSRLLSQVRSSPKFVIPVFNNVTPLSLPKIRGYASESKQTFTVRDALNEALAEELELDSSHCFPRSQRFRCRCRRPAFARLHCLVWQHSRFESSCAVVCGGCEGSIEGCDQGSQSSGGSGKRAPLRPSIPHERRSTKERLRAPLWQSKD